MSIIMESVGRKRSRPRRAFTPEFKAEIVELCQRGDRTVGQVAKDFDLTETAVRDWVKQAQVDAGEREGLTSDEQEELAALRRENRRLREDVEILRRATVHSTGQRNSAVILSAGVSYPRVFRGRALRRSAMRSRSCWVCPAIVVRLGKYWRRRRLVFSLVPRCQGLCGSAK